MDVAAYFAREWDDHLAVAAETRERLPLPFAAMLDAWVRTFREGGKLLLFGNGGSAADAQHIATELTIRFCEDRSPLPAIALTTDGSALTAAGNDLGFELVFARQVQALGGPNDLAVGLSTSGDSPNVVAALRAAREQGVATAALIGGHSGRVVEFADVVIGVPTRSTARVQEVHITLAHMLCGAAERELGLVG